jgi:ABC-2 type transport system ATP-binding protein
MIEAVGLTKRFGSTLAVDHLDFTVQPGIVTGFLGPNGAGKSTTMRLILGLDRPTAGRVTVNGRPYAKHGAPLREVGALLDAKAVHPGRTAAAHLFVLAQSNGIPAGRVDEVLGMSQRLGIAAAMLGDPGVLMFDEPVNGLDPEGILWIRNFLRNLAAEGRTVFVSSHLMSEMALTAEHLIVIGRGRMIADTSVTDFVGRASQQLVRVRSPRMAEFTALATESGWTITPTSDGALEVAGPTAAQIGDAVAARGIAVHELTEVQASLEEAFMELTGDSVEFHATGVGMAS